MSTQNTAFFHPATKAGLRTGILVHDLFNAGLQGLRQGILLGSKQIADLTIGDAPARVDIPRKGSNVVWAKEGESLDLVRKRENEKSGLLTAASVFTERTEAGGIRHFITHPVGDGKYLVLVQTGLFGTPEGHIAQVLENARNGLLPVDHGSFALDDGSTVVDKSEESADQVVEGSNLPPQAKRLRWWRPRTRLPGSDMPARKMDLWSLEEGAEILVADIWDGHDCRITIRNGQVVKVDAPRNARQIVGDFMAKRSRPTRQLIETPQSVSTET